MRALSSATKENRKRACEIAALGALEILIRAIKLKETTPVWNKSRALHRAELSLKRTLIILCRRYG